MNMYLPLIIVVLSNTVYHICAKSSPEQLNPFASLSVTYIVASAVSLIMYFMFRKGGTLAQEYHQINWSTIVFGLTLVGLEAGFIYMYRAGWNVSTGQLVSSALLAVMLIVVGVLIYRETVTAQNLLGIVICMIGLYFINK